MSGYPTSLLVLFLLVWAALSIYLWFAGKKPSEAGQVLHAASMNKVLVLTAAVGGGHEAAGRAVRAELEKAGYTVAMTDGIREMSHTLNWLLVRGYRRLITGLPGPLGTVFAATSRRAGAATVRTLVGMFCADRLLRILREEQPDLVLSTYPLVTSALGRLRKDGRLSVPAVAVVPDYGVHPLWVDPDIDLHLVVSQPSAVLVEKVGGSASVVHMPVAPAFREAPPREEARTTLGLPGEGFVILVVGGAWGIGNLEEAARSAAKSGIYTVVVTGNNTSLKRRLTAEFSHEEDVRILGWRDDLPLLMAAADCMIQNAGGMTCIEAIESGLPILMFDPIPGLGEFNASIMEQAGVASWARSAVDLSAILRYASRGEPSLRIPQKEPFAPSISETISPLFQDTSQPAVARRPAILASVAVLAPVLWLIFASLGVALAAGELHLRGPGYAPSPGRISVGVRVEDPATAAALESSARRERVPLTIFATSQGARGLYPAADLSFGVVEEPTQDELPSWGERKAEATASEIQRSTGTRPDYFLAAPRTGLVALADVPPGTRLVVPQRADEDPHPGLLVVDSSGLGPNAARQQLLRTLKKVRGQGLRCVPLSRL